MTVSTMPRTHVKAASGAWSSADWGIFIVRFVLGIIFFLHGSQKVLGWFGGPGMEGAVGMMGHMGIAPLLAYLSMFTEFIGGIFLIVGFLSRVAAIGLFINMVVAVALVHFKNGFFLGGGPGPGYEYNVALMAMALAVLVAGPGVLSLVDIEGKVFTGRRYPEKSASS